MGKFAQRAVRRAVLRSQKWSKEGTMQRSPQAPPPSTSPFPKSLATSPSVVAALLIGALAGAAGCKKGSKPPPPPAPTDAAPVDAAPVDAAPPAGVPILAVDVPPGFNYPGLREEIQTWADTWNLNKITAKAWDLWGGMTASTEQKADGALLPVWETWCGNEEVFTRTCGKGLRPARRFRNAAQLTHALRTGRAASPSDIRLASFNKFNPPMAAYLMKAQPGPGGVDYDYTQQSSLAALNQAWPAGTSIADRAVQEAPYTPPSGGQQGSAGIEIKPVMFLVKQSGLSPVPLWQGVAGALPSTAKGAESDCSKGPSPKCHPSPNLWTTCVLVDPAGTGEASTVPAPASPAQIASVPPALLKDLSCKTFLYAPLSTIYGVQMNAQEAQEFNTAQGNGNAVAGDYAVLTAMHVNTKEIVNWTWQTFWWQPGGDPPDNFPGSKAGMTDKIDGLWRNYAMCSAYDQTQGTKSKTIQVCFNPFLETSAGIPDGTQSNCMSCHGMATVGSTIGAQGIATLPYPEGYTKPIAFKTDPRFATFTRTDFSWAIPGDAQPPSTK
jgi:hypothetical protein